MLVKLDGVRSATTALQKSGLDWTVREEPVYDSSDRVIPSHKTIVRADTGQRLSVVKKSFHPIDNYVFSFFDIICQRYGATYQYGGMINNGCKVFLQASLDAFEIQKGDEIVPYICLLNSFDSSSSLKAFISPVRLFCSNQLTKCIRSATTNISIRHTSGIHEKVNEGFRIFNLSVAGLQVFKQKASFLAKKPVNKKQVNQFLDEMVPINTESKSTRIKNKRKRIVELFTCGKGNKGQSCWDLFNGYAEHLDWDGKGCPDRLLESRLFGHRASSKGKAFEVAMAL